LLDIGSGSGLTLSKLAALSKCKVAVGVEIEAPRHIISSIFNRFLMTINCDLDIPIWCVNEDIKKFPNLNGFSKEYMYDKVFTPDVMQAIALSFNASISVQYIASTQDLLSYGFEVNLPTNLGNQRARGGKMGHTFYLYESKRYSAEWLLHSDISVKEITESIAIAISKETRFKETESIVYAFHNSESGIRPNQIHKALGEINSNIDDSPSNRLFHQLTGQKSITINQTLLTLSLSTSARKSSTYEFFNLKELASVGRSEASAATHKTSKNAIIVPSYEGRENGRILFGIIVDNKGEYNTKYFACVYDTGKETFHEVILSSVMNIFDHENSFPAGVDIDSLFKVFSLYIFSCKELFLS
jgi:hypothetical protein